MRSSSQVARDFRGERAYIDRFRDVTVESCGAGARAVFRQRVRRQCNDLPGAFGQPLEFLEQRVAIATRQLNIEQHEVGCWLVRTYDVGQPVAIGQSNDLMSFDCKQRRQQLQIVRLIFDDDDNGHTHRACGRVNQKVLPFPISLSTPMAPPCSSISRRDSASPSPVPSYLRLADASSWENSWNSLAWSSVAMPIPVSVTAIRISEPPLTGPAATVMRPPSGVNLMAFESRLSSTCRTRPRSACTRSPGGGAVTTSACRCFCT